jgi:hypothetical protein
MLWILRLVASGGVLLYMLDVGSCICQTFKLCWSKSILQNVEMEETFLLAAFWPGTRRVTWPKLYSSPDNHKDIFVDLEVGIKLELAFILHCTANSYLQTRALQPYGGGNTAYKWECCHAPNIDAKMLSRPMSWYMLGCSPCTCCCLPLTVGCKLACIMLPYVCLDYWHLILYILCSLCCVIQTPILQRTRKLPECSARTSVSTTAKFVRSSSRAGLLIKGGQGYHCQKVTISNCKPIFLAWL